MKIAIPLTAGRLSGHFGHCEEFALVEADPASKQILNQTKVVPPQHAPGILPRWLHEQGVEVVIAGGMGPPAGYVRTAWYCSSTDKFSSPVGESSVL